MWWKFRKKEATEVSSKDENTADLRSAGLAPLSNIAKKVKEVEIVTRKPSAARLAGQYKSRFRGQGMQFSDSRVYQAGDDVRHIDWRTSARSANETYVKTYEEERELNIICAVDMSSSTNFGSGDHTKLDAIALAVATITFSALKNNDRVGLLLFTDQVERFVPARKGKKHAMRILDELLGFRPKRKGTNINAAMSFLAATVSHHSIVFLASDFQGTWDPKRISLLRKKFDLIAMPIHDPKELQLPAIGLVELEDPETGENLLVDTSSDYVQKDWNAKLQKDWQQVLERLNRLGVQNLPLATTTAPSDALMHFFHTRKRGR